MLLSDPTPSAAATELLRRRKARSSLVHFAQAIEIPGAPISDEPDEWIFRPVGSGLAVHHVVMLEAIQRCIETPYGRLLIFMPPGAAKTTYTSVVAPAWAMGKWPGFKVINTSYSDTPALRSSRRCRQIVNSGAYRSIWPAPVTLVPGSASVEEWTLTNDATALWSGLLGSITSARCDLGIIDDPVSGREDADSEAMRRKTWDAYRDDFKTRLKPKASIIIMQTRWHEDDLSGAILPENYKGESGPILCRDGQVWEVLNIPAKAEHADDPLGRARGAYLWPEWFDAQHWAQYENEPRTWSALYQQRPQPDSGGQFERGWFNRFELGQEPAELRKYGASDFAVTKKTMDNHPDFTEHGVFGVDPTGDLWVLAWWFGQEATDVTIDAFLDLVDAYGTIGWFDEGGGIKNALEGSIERRMRERKVFVAVDYLTSSQDKIARVAGFRGRARARTVHIPKTAWGDRLIAQLCSFPFGRFDDAVDVCGNIGRALGQIFNAAAVPAGKPEPPKQFTQPWFDARDEIHRGHDDQAERAFYNG